MTTCERCHAPLKELEPTLAIIVHGKVYVFCGVLCLEKFVRFKGWRE